MSEPIPYMRLDGTSAEMGDALGRAKRGMIQAYVRSRWQRLTDMDAEQRWEAMAAASLEIVKAQAPESYAELAALSKAAEVDLRHAYLAGGLTDALDFVASSPGVRGFAEDRGNCTGLIGHGKAPVLAQTWDMPRDAQAFALLLDKRYTGGPQILTVTTCLGLVHLGLSSYELGVGTNNLGHPEPRVGVHFSVVLNELLLQPEYSAALRRLRELPRMSAHNYTLVSRQQAAFVEATPSTVYEMDLGPAAKTARPRVHTNHYLDERHRAVETWPSESSVGRLQQAEAYWTGGHEVSIANIRTLLAQPGISRPVYEAVATIAGVIIEPEARLMRVCWGPTAANHWQPYTLEGGEPSSG